ncbi:hypothetical protein DQ04_00461020 [Trypanosoma grayi]|uniref:hypothetical protein n=1 Tax=Trypanosoma grayi TaxID=71804 RepID=UPI0004F49E99|nr:hypothetical protein DQ04_00461020 [Trypanosoma grayi]KEG14448.1 hypothetical protein DQ04_00461020 [Trypanosoma grayi]
MLLVAALLFVFGVAVASVLVEASQGCRCYVHASVAVALLPLAALVTLGFGLLAQKLVEYIHDVAQSGVLPPFLSYAALRARPIEGQSVTLLDIQLVAILLLLSYAATVVLRRLVDIVRLLKISRRRLVMK